MSINLQPVSVEEVPTGLNIYRGHSVYIPFFKQSLVWALRRAGSNPTELELMDNCNKFDDGSGTLNFPDFCNILRQISKEKDPESHFKYAFRAFSKDEKGW